MEHKCNEFWITLNCFNASKNSGTRYYIILTGHVTLPPADAQQSVCPVWGSFASVTSSDGSSHAAGPRLQPPCSTAEWHSFSASLNSADGAMADSILFNCLSKHPSWRALLSSRWHAAASVGTQILCLVCHLSQPMASRNFFGFFIYCFKTNY